MPSEVVSVPASKAGRPKSVQKRLDILAAAAELFLQNGVTATSMDMVAKQAGVSKQTVYSHFKNKDALFAAVIDWKCDEHQLDAAHMAGPDTPVIDVLTKVGNQFVNLLLDPQAIAMYRIVIAEGASNPHVSEIFYNAGPKHSIDVLCECLHTNAQLNLSADEAHHLTIMFFNMLKGEFHMHNLMGLPYEMNAQKQREEVGRVVQHIVTLIEHYGR